MKKIKFYEPTERYSNCFKKTSTDEEIKIIFNLDLIKMVGDSQAFPNEISAYEVQLKQYSVDIPIDEIIKNFKDFPHSKFMELFSKVSKLVKFPPNYLENYY